MRSPAYPARYGLQFSAAGAIDVARVTTTRMACPPGSLSGDSLRGLKEVNTYLYRDGDLSLTLPLDSGIHTFVATLPPEPPATPTAG